MSRKYYGQEHSLYEKNYGDVAGQLVHNPLPGLFLFVWLEIFHVQTRYQIGQLRGETKNIRDNNKSDLIEVGQVGKVKFEVFPNSFGRNAVRLRVLGVKAQFFGMVRLFI